MEITTLYKKSITKHNKDVVVPFAQHKKQISTKSLVFASGQASLDICLSL
jgi:hypothetical protein